MGCAALLVIGEFSANFCPLDGQLTLTVIIIQMLLSNRFLTGHNVAQVLVHYEDLVGMAFW